MKTIEENSKFLCGICGCECESYAYDEDKDADVGECCTDTPIEVTKILNSFNEDADAYAECKRIVSELESIGWTADWGLDGELYDLKPLSLIPLDSVGCYIDTKSWIVYARKENKEIDLDNGVHLDDCTEEWLSEVSTSDLLILAHKL